MRWNLIFLITWVSKKKDIIEINKVELELIDFIKSYLDDLFRLRPRTRWCSNYFWVLLLLKIWRSRKLWKNKFTEWFWIHNLEISFEKHIFVEVRITNLSRNSWRVKKAGLKSFNTIELSPLQPSYRHIHAFQPFRISKKIPEALSRVRNLEGKKFRSWNLPFAKKIQH